MGERKIRMAVLLSGSGTTFQYIQDRIEEGKLDAETMVVVSSREDAYGLERARNHNIPAVAVSIAEGSSRSSRAAQSGVMS